MNREITSYEQLHELMTRTVEGIGHIGEQLILIEKAGYTPEEYHRQRDLMFAYLIQERAKLDYYRTLSENYMTVLHDYEVLRMLNQENEIPGLGVSQVDRKQLEEEIIRLSAVLPEGLKAEISGNSAKEEEKVEEDISSIEDLDKRIRDEQDKLVELHRQSRQIEESVLDEAAKAERKAELQPAFTEVGENLAKYISMRENYTAVKSNRERIRRLGSMTPSDEVERIEIERSIEELERENARKSEILTSALLESMIEKEHIAAQEEVDEAAKAVETVVPETKGNERESEVQEEVPVEETEVPVEEIEKELNNNNIEEKLDKEIEIEENDDLSTL